VRRDLVEWLIVTAFLALAAAGAVAIFGDEIRAALGISRPAARAEPRGPDRMP
jgi:hypothetical protein